VNTEANNSFCQHRSTNFAHFTGNVAHEKQVFENFLCVVFARPYQIAWTSELATLTEMSRYYAALPIVSETVYAAMVRSEMFAKSILGDPCSVLVSAKTLRNVMLFKDGLILSISPWSAPRYRTLVDEGLLRIADSVRSHICTNLEEMRLNQHNWLLLPSSVPNHSIPRLVSTTTLEVTRRSCLLTIEVV
jgi:hypothetical protein